MKVKMNAVISLSLMTMLFGCAAPKHEKITFTPHSESNSQALNLANQTLLTKPMWYGKTINSPLRDFTLEEVEEGRIKMQASRGGDTALLSGAFAILTGNMTGLIDVAGGGFANIAKSDHLPVSNLRLMVELPMSQYKSEEDAQQFIINAIETATVKTMEKFGHIEKIELENKYQVFELELDGKRYNVGGLTIKPEFRKDSQITTRNFSVTGLDGSFYTYGMEEKETEVIYERYMNTLVNVANPMIFSAETGTGIDLEEFYKDYSSFLPQGFYVYVPSFPKVKYNSKTYTNYDHIVPSIYTEGKQLQFIKP